MKVLSTKLELDKYLSELRLKKVKIGFVPTMGALHQGHIELVKQSLVENDYTLVSIFINQRQFNNLNDFQNYPITREADIKLLEQNDCDAVFIPDVSEIFPPHFQSLRLDLGKLDEVLEGPMRPGHFDGVVQVVHQFFHLIKPDSAYFGLKDFQQCQVIKALKTQAHPHIHLKFCETKRDANGLALSSRNERLSDSGKVNAAQIFKVLSTIQSLSKHIVVKDALDYGRFLLQEKEIEVEYLELAHAESLQSSKKWLGKGKNALLIAAYIEGVRLIDNIVF